MMVKGRANNESGEATLNFGAIFDTEAEAAFREVVENALDIISVLDPNGRYLYASPSIKRLLGYHPIELIGSVAFDPIHADDLPHVLEAVQEVFETGRISRMVEFRMRHRDGSWRIVESVAKSLYSGNEPGGLVVNSRDITERREAENALRESEERFKRAFQQSAIGIALVSPEGRWLQVNSQLLSMLGYSEAELLATDFQSLTYPDDLDLDLDYVSQILRNVITSYEMEKRYLRKDGTVLWALLNVALVRDTEGSPLYFISQVLDISRQKLAERALQEANDTLEARVERRTAQLSETMASLRSEIAERERAEHRLQQVRDALQIQHTRLEALYRMGQIINSTLDSDTILDQLTDEAMRVTNASHGQVLVIRNDRSSFERCSLRGFSEEEAERARTLPLALDRGVNGRAYLTQQVVHVDDVRLEENYFPLIPDTRTELAVPIIRDGLVLGNLDLQSPQVAAFHDVDLNYLKTLADQVGIALANAELFRAMEHSRRDWEATFNAMQDAVVLIDRAQHILRANEAFRSLMTGLGYQSESALLGDGKCLREHCALAVETARPVRCTHAYGERLFDVQAIPLGEGAREGNEREVIIYVLRDITERKRAEEQLRHTALHDSLTGLANRTLFLDRLNDAIQRHKRRPQYGFAVLFLDLDRFKIINDSLGHLVGDELLIAIALRITSCLRTTDKAARLGGDEFAILLDDLESVEDATRVADRIQHALQVPFEVNGHTMFTSASIGIAFSASEYDEPDEILRDADIAMYRAKKLGPGRCELFDTAMHQQAVARLKLEADLRLALERDEFRLHYQPIIDLGTGDIVSLEALVRWQHPERGLVPPMEFIPVAEETGLIVALGLWVLKEGCCQLRQWQQQIEARSELSLSVNLSPVQIVQADLATQVQYVLQETGLDPRCLRLEITESMLIRNHASITDTLFRLQAMKVGLHLDDFGTGYSSLSYLHRLPIDVVKIDRSFVWELGEDNVESAIVSTIMTLAHKLGMDVIAEGVESADQIRLLRAMDCRYAQGFAFARPADSETIDSLLRSGMPPAPSAAGR